jgi:hypothetical protein
MVRGARQLHFATLHFASGYVFRISPFGLQALGAPGLLAGARLLHASSTRRKKHIILNVLGPRTASPEGVTRNM